MRRRTINNMNGGYRGYTQQTDPTRPTPPPPPPPVVVEKEIIKEVIKKDTGPITLATSLTAVGSLLVGAAAGIAAYRKYQNNNGGIGYDPDDPPGGCAGSIFGCASRPRTVGGINELPATGKRKTKRGYDPKTGKPYVGWDPGEIPKPGESWDPEELPKTGATWV